jgi:hypothetical protein
LRSIADGIPLLIAVIALILAGAVWLFLSAMRGRS